MSKQTSIRYSRTEFNDKQGLTYWMSYGSKVKAILVSIEYDEAGHAKTSCYERVEDTATNVLFQEIEDIVTLKSSGYQRAHALWNAIQDRYKILREKNRRKL